MDTALGAPDRVDANPQDQSKRDVSAATDGVVFGVSGIAALPFIDLMIEALAKPSTRSVHCFKDVLQVLLFGTVYGLVMYSVPSFLAGWSVFAILRRLGHHQAFWAGAVGGVIVAVIVQLVEVAVRAAWFRTGLFGATSDDAIGFWRGLAFETSRSVKYVQYTLPLGGLIGIALAFRHRIADRTQ